MNKLFVYGIFLDADRRERYGMSHPRYDTVLDYATFGGGIVMAYKIPDAGLSLTGLTVDIDPDYWERLDELEAGYERITITTVNGVQAYIYVGKEQDGQEESDTASGEIAQEVPVR